MNPERQEGPHAHFIQTTPDNRLALVADLGLDKLLVHRFDATTGSLAPGNPAFVRTEPGAGPRHAAFAPSGKSVYLVNELVSTVTLFAYAPDEGTLHSLQTVSTLPEGYAGANTTAEIAVDAKGRNLYVSNRGHDTIAVFSIDPDDIKRIALPVLRHRVATNFQAQAEGMDSDALVARLLEDIKPPEPEKLSKKR